MPKAFDYIASLALGTDVTQITGVPGDGMAAAGYAAWIQSITGKTPTVITLPNKRAKMVLSREQVLIMQKWLDTQVSSSLAKPAKPPTLEIDMGPVFLPWTLKYAIPAAVLLVTAGWVAHWYLSR
jgi:hypothetical protein